MTSRPLRWGLPIALLAIAIGIQTAARKIDSAADSPFPLGRTIRHNDGVETLARAGAGWRSDVIAADVPLELPLRSGQTVGGVLSELGLSGREVGAIVAELSEHADLRRLKPEDGYAVVYEPGTERVAAFELTLASRGRVRVARAADSWQSSWREFERRTELDVVKGVLVGALESSIERAGGDARLAVLMADVFQWDLDFNRDLRLEDRFEILYQKIYVDGSYSNLGEILAVHYTNLGKTLEAYRFGDAPSYYDADGRPLRKMFLRSPMRYSRITSRYSNRRFHPVLKRYRPHHGVDYGAPTGTPVRVTSNGVVSFAGWDGGGGRTVKVRHPNGYLTAYLHLSKFASGVRSGKRVSQGDTIGYVGSTGLATGSHLDYRVQKHGRWIDPLSLKSVPAEPIPVDNLDEFTIWRDTLRASLAEGGPTAALLASVESRSAAGGASIDSAPTGSGRIESAGS